jgi:hypothetical protein
MKGALASLIISIEEIVDNGPKDLLKNANLHLWQMKKLAVNMEQGQF